MEILQQLKSINSAGTNMISLIIPSNNNIWLTIKRLEVEYGTSSNIKDRTNRQMVQSALRSIIYQLRLLKGIPSNGVAIYSGKECYVWRNKERMYNDRATKADNEIHLYVW